MLKITSFILSLIILFSNLFGASMKITVTDKQEQEITGFGTSAAWWAQMVSDDNTREFLAKELYSSEGLELNIYRYNIGGGYNPKNVRIADISRRTESFYYFNEETGKFEYDFSRDANAQKMLQKALSYGCIDTVVLFANSPHYSMTKNGETAGSNGECNIAPERYRDFAEYMLTIADYFLSIDVPVKYISPINEPQWDWGGDWVGQEGCHYNEDEIIALLEVFAEVMDERGTQVKLLAPESGQLGRTNNRYFNAIISNKKINKHLGSLAYHSYWEDEGFNNKIKFGLLNQTKYKDYQVAMSEWCELPCKHDVADVEAAVIMARVITNDFNLSYANSWESWVALNNADYNADGNVYSDGLFFAENGNYNSPAKAARFSALEHFSRFIPVGSRLLSSFDNRYDLKKAALGGKIKTNYAAFLTPEGKTVIVIVNEDSSQTIKLNVKNASEMQIYTTDSGHSCELTYDGQYQSDIFMEENSIVTAIID